MKSLLRTAFLLLPILSIAGCSNTSVDVVDLNKVLDALVAVLDDKGANPDAANLAVKAGDGDATKTETVAAIAPDKQDPEKEAAFLKKYADKLNEMKVMSTTVGVAFAPGGEIVGFKDANKNNVQDMGETKEFTVTIDVSNSRLVAADNNGHHRPYGFRPGGLMTGYFLGSMLGRQNSFYSGATAAARPNFNNTPMSSPDYHKSAVSSARSKASAASSAARARTGSKGFSFGK